MRRHDSRSNGSRSPRRLPRYECEEIPCIHIVIDPPRKRFAVFIEYEDGDYIHVSAEKVLEAARRIEELLRKRWREASSEEVDEIAERYLEASRVE
ncbi:hypothetical protein Pyrfu_0076 [Pyrolobus fumarii 1A]|uniref:Uncharacterized protein n=1 Tax=Pyrolobus fumarii (strain DSM 11204 / 1A) TaxID=694429 RepID=G0EE32_PYRF1|nr:hypothetical protein [Pyrolobus fumarii]AEM37948.1 hypothetical protein Pyrfu_0076 [Pyrolobus fumarii 1A]